MIENSLLKIRLFGDPVLRKKTKPVKQVTPEHRDILNEMARLMHAGSGIGLAASQVGVNESMVVVDIGRGLYKLINPKIVEKEGYQVIEEGCLSLPGLCIKVKRARKVAVKAEDENSKPVTIEAEGLLACVFQHEIDHLKGKLIIDYVSLLEKLKLRNKLKELKKLRSPTKLANSGPFLAKFQWLGKFYTFLHHKKRALGKKSTFMITPIENQITQIRCSSEKSVQSF